MDIPLKAQVLCTDGHFGNVTCVILHPKARQVTQVVVKERSGGTQRLVPLKFIEDAKGDSIYLNIETMQARRLKRFVVDEFVADGETIMQRHERSPRTASEQKSAARVEQIPPGELALRQGARVHALDSKLGTVNRLRVVVPGGRITHFVVRQGNIWDKRDVPLADDHVKSIEETSIYFDLNKEEVGTLSIEEEASRKKEPI